MSNKISSATAQSRRHPMTFPPEYLDLVSMPVVCSVQQGPLSTDGFRSPSVPTEPHQTQTSCRQQHNSAFCADVSWSHPPPSHLCIIHTLLDLIASAVIVWCSVAQPRIKLSYTAGDSHANSRLPWPATACSQNARGIHFAAFH